MAEHKDYGLSGVHRTLQLGKQGPLLVGDNSTDTVSVTMQDASTLTTMSGANATSGTHFITKSQLDSVYTEATFLANVNYNDSSPILLGNISSGTKTIITTFEVTTAFDANAVVTVGDNGNNSLLLSDNYAEVEVTGTYQTINTVEFASNSTLNIYVTQGGATQGAGTVLVSVVDGPVVDGGTINYGGSGSGIALTDLSVSSNSPSGNGSLSYDNTTGVFTFTPADTSSGGSGISDIVQDTTPQLGGNLDLNGSSITGSGNINILGDFITLTDTGGWELTLSPGMISSPNSDSLVLTSDDSTAWIQINKGSNGGAVVIASEDTADGVVQIKGGTNSWKFYSNANIEFPNGTVQTTAYTGQLVNGTTAVRIPLANGSIVFDVDGSIDIVDINPDGLQVWGANANVNGNINVTGYANITGNVNATNFVGTATKASQVTITSNGGAADWPIVFTSAAGTGKDLYIDSGASNFTWNPSTNQLKLTSIQATGSINTGGTMAASGNITGNYFLGNGRVLTGILTTTVTEGDNLYFTTDRANTAIDAYTGDILNAGNIAVTDDITVNGKIVAGSIEGFDGVGAVTVQSKNNGNAYFQINDTGDSYIGANQNFEILTDNDNNRWIFDTTGTLTTAGNLTVGGNVISTGQFVGDGSALTNVTVSVAGNIVGTSQNVSLVAGSYTATFDNTGILTLPAVGGDEGGEINFGIPTANTTLTSPVKVDVYRNSVRFFEGSNDAKGAYIDLSQAGTGVSTLLNNRVSGYVDAGTYLTMDNLKATVTTSVNRGLSLATESGTMAGYASASFSLVSGSPGGGATSISLTTSASSSILGYNFLSEGDTATYVIRDNTNSRVYRITLIIGPGWNSNFISIERLI